MWKPVILLEIIDLIGYKEENILVINKPILYNEDILFLTRLDILYLKVKAREIVIIDIKL
uniref:Uncharacterized protein n=1 Tax=viral metagenome TaxID=1070528 RepID=A0A6M3XHE8_9ZZZZ